MTNYDEVCLNIGDAYGTAWGREYIDTTNAISMYNLADDVIKELIVNHWDNTFINLNAYRIAMVKLLQASGNKAGKHYLNIFIDYINRDSEANKGLYQYHEEDKNHES